jgi:general secretion pathway protein I
VIIPAMSGKSQKGFTLLELLLAFVVFALSFAVVLEILSGSMRNTVRARHYSEAAMTAQSIMDRVGLEIPLEEGISEAGEAGSYRWELDITAYEMASDALSSVQVVDVAGMQLLEVYLAVSWGEPPRDQSHEFSTIKAIMPLEGRTR